MNKSWWQQFEGQTIDNTYRMVRLLGTGGFGGVFLSDHVVEGTLVRHVAVKLVVADADQMQRQLAELVTATTLRHPSLLSCFHAGSTTFANMRLLYLVMELADEGLETRLEKGVLRTSEVLELTRNLVQGLAYLHERRIVHRDVKPANVLKVEGAWKLSDFGTVRQSSDTTSRTNMIIGSMTYMPPESFDGVVSPAWDMWSLGVLLLRALTGQPAYAETSEHQLMRAILDKEPAIPSNLPGSFSDIVRGCLVKDYRRRWNTAKVVSALEPRLPEKELVPTLAEAQLKPPAEPARSEGPEPVSRAELLFQAVSSPSPARIRSTRFWIIVAATSVCALVLAVVAVYRLTSHNEPTNTLAPPSESKTPPNVKTSTAEKTGPAPANMVYNKEAIRQGILTYLSQRPELSKMDVTVSKVTYDHDKADATADLRAKNSPSGLDIDYVLDLKGDKWVVRTSQQRQKASSTTPDTKPTSGPSSPAQRQRQVADQAEYDLYDSILKDTNARTRLDKLNTWNVRYPNSAFANERQKLIVTTTEELRRLSDSGGGSSSKSPSTEASVTPATV